VFLNAIEGIEECTGGEARLMGERSKKAVLVSTFISWTTPLFPASPAYAARASHTSCGCPRLKLIDHSSILVQQHMHSILCLFRLPYSVIGWGILL
jgi:hypothetical protein